MAEQFYTIPTAIGKAKIANSIALGAKVNLKTMKIGDSNGIYYNPSESQTDLVHTVYSCEINSIEIDESNSNWINVVCAIPADVGDFFIREVGIFDDNNDLIAIGKYPETYKPLASNGSTKELYIKMTFEVTNVSSVTLKIDPTVILATKNDINILTNSISSINAQLSDIVPINIKGLGFLAKGDGVTDDTQAIKDAFQSAINVFNSTGKLPPICIPNGKYILSSEIDWEGSLLSSDTYPVFRMYSDSKDTEFIIKHDGLGFWFKSGCVHLSNLSIRGEKYDINTVECTAIRFGKLDTDDVNDAVFQSKFENIGIFKCNKAIELGNIFDSSFHDINIWWLRGTTPIGVNFIQTTANCNINNIQFNRLHLEDLGNNSKLIKGAPPTFGTYNVNIKFDSCHFETRGYLATALDVKNIINLDFDNCYFVQNSGHGTTVLQSLNMFIFEKVYNITFDTCHLSIEGAETSPLTNKLFKLINVAKNISFRNCDISPGFSMGLQKIIDLYTLENWADTKNEPVLKFYDCYINNVDTKTAKRRFELNNETHGLSEKFIGDVDNNSNLNIGWTSSGILTERKTTFNNDGTLKTYGLTSQKETTIVNTANNIFTYYNSAGHTGMYIIYGTCADTTKQLFAIVMNNGTSIFPVSIGADVSLNTTQTANKMNIILDTQRIKITNQLGSDLKVSVIPMLFNPS